MMKEGGNNFANIFYASENSNGKFILKLKLRF